jgi:hypothetical protein
MKLATVTTAALTLALTVGMGEVKASPITPINPNASGSSSPSPEITQDALNRSILGNLQGESTSENGQAATQEALQQQEQQIQEQPSGPLGQVQNTIRQVGGAVSDISNQVGDIGDQIGRGIDGLLSQFNLQALLRLLGIDLSNPAQQVSGGLEGGAQSNSAGVEPGAIALPDLTQAREAIARGRTSATEEFLGTKTGGTGSPVIKRDLESLLVSSTTREVAEATALSDEGQQQLRENAEAANQALTVSSEMAADSESQDVSQNILRNLSGQMQASQQTDTLLAIDAQLRARDDSLRNFLIANSLDEIQGQNIAKRRVEASAYSSVITQGGQFMLPGFNPGN